MALFKKILTTAVLGAGMTVAALGLAAAPASAAGWCNGPVCLYQDGSNFYGAATGTPGTQLQLLGPGGVVLETVTIYESSQYTHSFPDGEMACIVNGPCATYLD